MCDNLLQELEKQKQMGKNPFGKASSYLLTTPADYRQIPPLRDNSYYSWEEVLRKLNAELEERARDYTEKLGAQIEEASMTPVDDDPHGKHIS